MRSNHIVLIFLTFITLCSCKKFLEERSDKSLAVPSSLKDLQALLDNTAKLNSNYAYTIEIGSDDFYVSTADWLARTFSERNAHIWSEESFIESSSMWGLPYTVVYTSNVVLNELQTHSVSEDELAFNSIKGQALFFRSFAFHNLLLSFAKPYSEDSASFHLGIPLRLDPDFNKPTKRATLKRSYDQMIEDVKASTRLLPDQQQFKTRPSRNAAYALLARIYLSMSKYDLAYKYADSSLQMNSSLIDYNTLNASATRPIPLFNAECIFHSVYVTSNSVNILSKVDTILFRSYLLTDLRRSVFFNSNTDGSYTFKGSYDGSVRPFNGLANDEMYLIRAEALARAGNTAEAMNDLNTLLLKRWKTNSFVPFTAIDATDALNIILVERRKELLMRGLRWMDLRRLNKEPVFAKIIKRVLDGKEYTLYPNTSRYVYRIPDEVIRMTDIEQNE